MKEEKLVKINTIEGYEDIKDCYWISNSDEDKIINRDTGKQLKPWNNRGYSLIKLGTIDGKYRNCKIHILKAKAFLFGPNPLGANIVRHLNDIRTDNRLENLAFGTQSDNNLDCIRNGKFNYEAAAKNGAKNGNIAGAIGGAVIAKKVSKPIRCIETGIIYPNAYEANRQLNIPQGNISKCCNDIRKTAGGYHFRFVDKEYTDK